MYKITNTSNGFTYIGSAIMEGGIRARLRMHYRNLVQQTHHSWSFQRDWNRSKENDWIVEVLFLSDIREEVRGKEQEYLDLGVGVKNASYNVLDTVDLSNMPEEVKQKISVSLRMSNKQWTTNTSGYRGVCWYKRKGQWKASISRDSIAYHIGYYDDKEVAHNEYLKVAALDDVAFAGWWKDKQTKTDTIMDGENGPGAKLSDAQVVQIRTMWASGKYSQKELAELFDVSPSWISNLVRPEDPKTHKRKPTKRYSDVE